MTTSPCPENRLPAARLDSVRRVHFLLRNFLFIFIFGEGNGNPLQYSCLENPVDRGAWWAAIYGVAQSRTRLKQFSMHTCIFIFIILFTYLCLAVLSLRCYMRSFSSCSDRGATLCCSVWASHCGSFSCGAWAQQLWCKGLVARRHVGSFQTTDQTCGPCIGRWMLNH